SSNPHNRQIAQPGTNMGQDRQMQMVRDNGRNQFRQYDGQNFRNQNGYNAVQNVKNQVVQNTVQNPARAEGNAIRNNGNQIRCYNCRGLGHLARNCIVKPRRRDAAYLQTQLLIAQKEETDKAPVYDLDGSAEVHNYENCYNNEIFSMFTQEERYIGLLEPIPEPYQVQQNDSNIISEVSSMEQDGGTVDQHLVTIEETHAYFESLYNNLAIEVEKTDKAPVYDLDGSAENDSNIISEVSSMEQDGGTVDQHLVTVEETHAYFESLYNNLAIEVEKKLALGYQNPFYLKQAQQKQESLYNGKVQLEKHDPPAVKQIWKISHDKAYNDMQQKIKQLQAQLGDLKGKRKDTSSVSNTIDPLSLKLENENVELEFQVSEQKDTTKGMSVNTQFFKQLILGKPPSSFKPRLYDVTPFLKSKGLPKIDETHALSKPITSKSEPTPQELKVVKNDNVIAPGMFRISPFKPFREEKRPRPRSNTKNDRVPSAYKSSCSKNKEVEVKEHPRNLLLSKNKKHMSSECNNVKLAIRNDKSKVVCAMCKQCLITANHDACVLNYMNEMNSYGKKKKANVSNNEIQKKQKPKVTKPKKVGSNERLASPKPSKPRSSLRWSPTGRLFDLKQKIIASSKFENQSDCSNGDNACFGDLQWGNILIIMVCFVEGLGHNLFSVGQFCDSDLEEIWLRVQQMMKGSDIRIQEKKAKFFKEWERFTSTDGESIESYYHCFSKLMNGIANLNSNGNGNVVAARAKGNAIRNNTEVHNYDNFYVNEIFNMSTQEEKYTELLEPIPKPHQVQQNDSNVVFEVSSVEQDGGTVDQHPKMALGYQNLFYLKQAQQKQQSLYNEKVLLEKHDPPVVYDLEEKLELAQESRLKMKQSNKEIKPANYTKINHLSRFFSQTAKSYEELYFSNTSKTANVSKSISIPNEGFLDDTTPSVAYKFLNEVSEQEDTTKCTSVNTQFRKQSILGKPPSSSRSKLYSVTPFLKSKGLPKIDETHALLKLVTSNSVPTQQESKVMRNDNVIAPGLFMINPFKTSREENSMPNKPIKASVRINPITVSQPHALTKNGVNTKSNGLSSTRVDNTAKTRRPQPRHNIKNDMVSFASKSTYSKNKEVEVEEHPRNLLLSKDKKHTSSECNNVKLDIWNDKSEVVYAMCKQCLINANHDVYVLNYMNGMNSHDKKQKANVLKIANQKKHKPQVKKPKKVGSIERLALPKPSKPRSCLRWSPTGRLFDHKGKIIASSELESQSDCSNGDNAYSGCSNHMTANLKLLINFIWKFLGTICFRNDHVAAIIGYGDLQWGNILITRVYFLEGLGHNLLSVGQFCDSDLEVAFRRNTCFVKNLEGVDLLKGNCTTNLYTINLHEMASASPICLMARATSTKSWIWHQRLSHLNFDTINDLSRNDLFTDHPKFKYHKEHLCPLLRIVSINEMRVYNRKTKKITETMNVTFDEISTMAFEQSSLKLELQSMTCGQINSGLDLTYAPSTITTQQPTERELDLLFDAMYDDYIGGRSSVATRTIPAAQAPQVLQTPTTSTTIAATAPTPTTLSSQATNIPNTSLDVDELETHQQHVQQQNNQGQLPPKTIADNVLNAMFDGNMFVNPFATPSTSAVKSSSSQYIDPSNMHTFYQPYPHEY
nr:integrase, catalytic region, zinc finger, CCHC-type, peptidase aspartic, catalytic [Tanacetum cinerariifolium]